MNDEESELEKPKEPEEVEAKYIGIGIMVGTLIGVLTDNIGLWLSMGLVFGVAYAQQQKKKSRDD